MSTCRANSFGQRSFRLHGPVTGMIDEVRKVWAFYRDRRPDAYDPLVAP